MITTKIFWKVFKNLIIQNCVFAIGIKLIGVVLSLTGKLALWQAMLIDVGSLLVVIVNGTQPLFSSVYRNAIIKEEEKNIIDIKVV